MLDLLPDDLNYSAERSKGCQHVYGITAEKVSEKCSWNAVNLTYFVTDFDFYSSDIVLM